jgi:hypothetical protein
MSTGDQRNWLERLADKIPGYSGYVDRERRRDIDKLHRTHLADRIRGLKTPLTNLIRDLTAGGRLMEVGTLDRTIKKLDALENRVRYASYGYAGFFDVVKIEQPQLEALYRFDLALVEHVDKLESKITELGAKSGAADALKAAATEVESAVDEVNRTFDGRQESINKFGADQPPGRPLFDS